MLLVVYFFVVFERIRRRGQAPKALTADYNVRANPVIINSRKKRKSFNPDVVKSKGPMGSSSRVLAT